MVAVRWDAVVIDCEDPERLARFWCALLGVQVRGRWRQYVGLHPIAPGQPRLILQGTGPEAAAARRAAGKNSVHLDLNVATRTELESEVDRAIGLGARLVYEQDDDEAVWRTLADPEGNLFCVVLD